MENEGIETNVVMQNNGKFGRPTGAHMGSLTLKISE